MGGEQGDPEPGAVPFDLGDSRDLAAAVRAAWAAPTFSPASGPVEVARPSTDGQARSAPGDIAPADPLAHLRGEVQRRKIAPKFALPNVRGSTLVASLGVAAALLAAAAFPVVSGGNPRPSSGRVEERARPTTSTSTRAASTTAFTYPPETLAPTATAPPPVAPPAPAEGGRAPAETAPTATTARPRTATTARPASSPTTKARAPTTTTTQAPPPPPDNGGGSSDPDEPPPYP